MICFNDLFFGGNEFDWIDLNRVAIPQADEQQRLLANLITQFSYTPTPHFWYFPRDEKAVVAMTGDDHGSGGTLDVVEHLYEIGPAGCQQPIDQDLVANWGCPRATSYIYPKDTTPLTDDQLELWTDWGFEMSDHPLFQSDASCVDFTSIDDLRSKITSQVNEFRAKFPSVPAPTTTRTHCIAWSDWDSQPKVDSELGIRLNTDYYYFSASWTNNTPGLFTGSGMPMRFAAVDGSLIDVYQAATYGADDATLRYRGDVESRDDPNAVVPAIGKALIDGALGASGYYGAFTIQVHSDEPADAAGRNALIADAMNRHVPIVSERQLLTWLDGRDSSKFTDVGFGADGKLRFTVVPGTGARGLQAMLPVKGSSGALSALTRDGVTVNFDEDDIETIKGVQYLKLPDASGDYVATYPAPSRPHPHVETGGGNNGGGGSTGGGPGPTAAGPVGAASTKPTKVAPFVTVSSSRFRPGAKRTFVLTVKLRKASRLVLKLRGKDGKVVRTIRVPKRKAGTTVRVRWDGKDRHGHYVAAGTYRYALTAIGNRYLKTARGSVAVLRAG